MVIRSLVQALQWAKTARAGAYLIRYAKTGLSDAEDLGSRCGFDDCELAEISDVLRARGLLLQADDRGLRAQRERLE